MRPIPQKSQLTFLAMALSMTATAVFFAGPAWAADPSGSKPAVLEQQLRADINQATREFVNTADNLANILASRPAKLDNSKWHDIGAAASEFKKAVTKVKAIRQQVSEGIVGVSNAGGGARTALNKLAQDFAALATEAQAEIDGTSGLPALPEPLLASVKREAVQYRDAEKVCQDLEASFAREIAELKDQVTVLNRCKNMLDRLDRAADYYGQLAEVGERLELHRSALTGFADQLNGVIDLMDGLNSKIKGAISGAVPKGPSQRPANSPPAAKSSSGPIQPRAVAASARPSLFDEHPRAYQLARENPSGESQPQLAQAQAGGQPMPSNVLSRLQNLAANQDRALHGNAFRAKN